MEEEDGLDVLGSVSALSAGCSNRVEETFKFLLPITEGVHFHASYLTGHADANAFVRFGFSLAHTFLLCLRFDSWDDSQK